MSATFPPRVTRTAIHYMKRQFVEEEVFDKGGWNDLRHTVETKINEEKNNQQQLGSR